MKDYASNDVLTTARPLDTTVKLQTYGDRSSLLDTRDDLGRNFNSSSSSSDSQPSLSSNSIEKPTQISGSLVPLYATYVDSFTKVESPLTDQKSQSTNNISAATATINVTYNGFTPESQAAFQYGVDIWESYISSPVTIEVVANWTPLGTGVLGSAGATTSWRNFTGAPVANTWYASALANKLAGTDLDTTKTDINANFSSNFSNWYFGTDGNTPAGKYDFVSVVLHELGHGLGFAGLMDYNTTNGQGSWGYGTSSPGIYDRFTVNGSGQSLINTSLFPNPSTALGNQLKSNNIFFNGTNATNANSGNNPKLYAPSTWNGGSSYSHLDESTYAAGNPNSLMTPQIGTAEAIHSPGAITLGMFQDMGWTTGSISQPGIYGTAWQDVNVNGIRDAGEAGLQNWTIFQDRNNNSVLDPVNPGNVINSTDIPKSILDLATVNSTLAVSGLSGSITDLNVKLDISHTYDTDLDVFLISPTGTRVELFTDVGSSGDNFTNTTLDDEATTSIASGTAPFTASFKPEGLLSSFDGQNPNGTWQLELTDDEGGDVGTLNGWSLTFNSATAEVSTLTDADGDYSFTNLNPGNYVIRQVLQNGWTPTTPDAYNVSWNYGDVVTNRDFGNVQKPTITISASDTNAAEPSDPGQFTISRTGSTGTALSVNYSLAGAATNGSDYNNLTGSVVIPVGSTTATINITPIDDILVEGDETVVANLTSNSAYTIGNANSATVTIADNDSAASLPTLTIKATDATAAEVATGAANPGVFTVTRTGDTGAALSVNYSLAGTATNGSDYNNLSGSVLIPVGSTTATIQVNVNNETLLEADETAIVTLTANSAYNLGTAKTATVTILDDDKTRVSITATDATAAEVTTGQPANPGLFTITRTGATDTEMSVNYTVGGTATKGTDYENPPTSVVIPIGATSVTLPINVLTDTQGEADETAVVTLTANANYNVGTVTGTAKNATVTIADDDRARVTVTATDASAAETTSGLSANPGVFTFTRTGPTDTALSVNYTVGGTATKGTDYENPPTSVVIPIGATSVTLPIDVIDDSLGDANETAIVTLTANSAYNLGTAKTATVTIADNEPIVTVTATDASAAETISGLSANPGVFTFTRTGSTDTALSVSYTVGGTATNGNDYNSVPTSVVIPIGATSVTLPIDVIDEALAEADETAIVTLTANSAYNLGTAKTATVNILDDDRARVTVTATDASAAETISGLSANPGVFTFTRTGSTDTALNVSYTVTGTATNGNDYNSVPTSVVIPVGASSLTVQLTPIDDLLDEANETAIVTLTAKPEYNVGTVTGTAKSARVTILDNDP